LIVDTIAQGLRSGRFLIIPQHDRKAVSEIYARIQNSIPELKFALTDEG